MEIEGSNDDFRIIDTFGSRRVNNNKGDSNVASVDGDNIAKPDLRKNTVQTVTIQHSQVFFMIGCQLSGSNWLRSMLSKKEDLIAPHPPHIMRDFMPRLRRYGDVMVQENLKVSQCIFATNECVLCNKYSVLANSS